MSHKDRWSNASVKENYIQERASIIQALAPPHPEAVLSPTPKSNKLG